MIKNFLCFNEHNKITVRKWGVRYLSNTKILHSLQVLLNSNLLLFLEALSSVYKVYKPKLNSGLINGRESKLELVVFP